MSWAVRLYADMSGESRPGIEMGLPAAGHPIDSGGVAVTILGAP